ncbi:MAG: helix-turn-helix transcriptional regulator, partial [Halobaculum sp.]
DDQTTGILRLSFRWTAFAEPVGEQNFRVHDVFLPNETWLPQLAADQVMFIEAPPDSGLVSSSYSFTDRTIRIEGPRQLSDRPIDMEYTLNEDTPTPTPTPTPTATRTPTATPSVTPTDATASPTTDQPPGDGSSDAITFGAVVVAITVVVVALFARQGGLTGGPVVSDPDGDDGGAAAVESASETTASPETATEEQTPETESSEEDGESESESDEDEPDVELLSDEERVEYLLDENGGRMRQADIVSETGWSDAKVSQLLSAMAEEGRIDKLRLGRENLISFPDADDTPGGADEE